MSPIPFASLSSTASHQRHIITGCENNDYHWGPSPLASPRAFPSNQPSFAFWATPAMPWPLRNLTLLLSCSLANPADKIKDDSCNPFIASSYTLHSYLQQQQAPLRQTPKAGPSSCRELFGGTSNCRVKEYRRSIFSPTHGWRCANQSCALEEAFRKRPRMDQDGCGYVVSHRPQINNRWSHRPTTVVLA